MLTYQEFLKRYISQYGSMKAVGAAWQKYKKGGVDIRDHTQHVPSDVMGHVANYLSTGERAALASVNRHSRVVIERHRTHQFEKKCHVETQGRRQCTDRAKLSGSGPCREYCQKHVREYVYQALKTFLNIVDRTNGDDDMSNPEILVGDDGIMHREYRYRAHRELWFDRRRRGGDYGQRSRQVLADVTDLVDDAIEKQRFLRLDCMVFTKNARLGARMREAVQKFEKTNPTHMGLTYEKDGRFEHALFFELNVNSDSDSEASSDSDSDSESTVEDLE